MFSASDSGTAVTALTFYKDTFIIAGANTVNPGFPRAAILRGIFVHSGCIVVNSAGNWTLRLRVDESGSDSATFSVGMAALPGSKDYGNMSTSVIVPGGSSYHIQADGPSRNFAVCRATLEWEIL